MNSEKGIHPGKTIRFESLAYGGDAVGHIGGRVVFVPGGVPGDEARIEITADKSTYMRGRMIEMLSPSHDRVEPFCPLSDLCGGCQWQSVRYDSQLEWKRRIVEETLRRLGGFDDIKAEQCLASPIDRGYRTVARYPVLRTKKGLVFGYYGRRTHRIIDIESCPVAGNTVNAIALSLRKLLNGRLSHLDVREIVIRASYNHPSSLVSLTLRGGKKLPETTLKSLEDIPGISGVSLWAIAGNGDTRHLQACGDRRRREIIKNVSFRIDERSFFQINIPQTENLVDTVGGMIDLRQNGKFVDGYGGVGLFSLCCARESSEVILFDTSGPAVKDSIFNARAAGLTGFRGLRAGAVEAFDKIGKADLIILDPPRTGLGIEAIDAACSSGAETIVYVSCNPATLARDLRMFCDRDYHIDRVVPIDMFPHTYHIETAVKLKRL